MRMRFLPGGMPSFFLDDSETRVFSVLLFDICINRLSAGADQKPERNE